MWLLPPLALALFVLPSLLAQPLGPDQGIYAAIADVINAGGMPYKDGFDVKGPGVFYLYAAAFSLGGSSVLAVRMMDAAVLLLLTGGVFAFLWQQGCRSGAAMGGLLVVLFVASFPIVVLGQPDYYALPLLLGLLVCALPARLSRRRWAMAGLLLALLVMLKIVYAVFALMLLPALLRDGWRGLVAGAVGFLLPMGLLVLWFWRQGALPALLDVYFVYNLTVHRGTAHGGSGWLFFWMPWISRDDNALLPRYVGLWMAALGQNMLVLLALAIAWVNRQQAIFRLLLLAQGAAMLMIALQNRHSLVHFQPLLLLSLLSLSLHWPQHYMQAGKRMVLAVPLLLFILSPVSQILIQPLQAWGLIAQTVVDGTERSLTGAYDAQVASFIRAHTTPAQRIYLWGFNGGIYHVAQRLPATRSTNALPQRVNTALREADARRELMHELAQQQPAAIIVQKNDMYSGYVESSEAALPSFPELAELIARDYTKQLSNPGYDVYLRR